MTVRRTSKTCAALLCAGLLCACAPSATPVSDAALVGVKPNVELVAFDPSELTGADREQACATYRVEVGEVLVWRDANGAQGRVPPYRAPCDGHAASFDGAVLSVKAATLAQALARIENRVDVLAWYDDLFVRFSGDTVSADSPARLDAAERAFSDTVIVTAQQDGGPEAVLIQNSLVTPIKIDPARSVIIRMTSPRLVMPWPEVRVNVAAGEVQAVFWKAR